MVYCDEWVIFVYILNYGGRVGGYVCVSACPQGWIKVFRGLTRGPYDVNNLIEILNDAYNVMKCLKGV